MYGLLELTILSTACCAPWQPRCMKFSVSRVAFRVVWCQRADIWDMHLGPAFHKAKG